MCADFGYARIRVGFFVMHVFLLVILVVLYHSPAFGCARSIFSGCVLFGCAIPFLSRAHQKQKTSQTREQRETKNKQKKRTESKMKRKLTVRFMLHDGIDEVGGGWNEDESKNCKRMQVKGSVAAVTRNDDEMKKMMKQLQMRVESMEMSLKKNEKEIDEMKNKKKNPKKMNSFIYWANMHENGAARKQCVDEFKNDDRVGEDQVLFKYNSRQIAQKLGEKWNVMLPEEKKKIKDRCALYNKRMEDALL